MAAHALHMDGKFTWPAVQCPSSAVPNSGQHKPVVVAVAAVTDPGKGTAIHEMWLPHTMPGL